MASRTSAYLLRPNKAVDRLLFADLLERLDAPLSINDNYSYVGMGGDFMEDFRLIHERFPKMKMVSIEEREVVSNRQKFNRPHSAIKFETATTRDWLERNLPGKKPQVVWLDFQGKQRQDQISQFQTLVAGAAKPSVIRLTVDASIETLGEKTGPVDKLQRLRSQLGDLLPDNLTPEDLMKGGRGLEDILRESVIRAASKALANQPSARFQPLLVSAYQDTSRMLTVTGVVAERQQLAAIIDQAQMSQWQFSWLRSQEILRIELPELSARERLHLDQMLPVRAEKPSLIHKSFGFWFGGDEAQSEAMIASYIKFAGLYPQFARVSI